MQIRQFKGILNRLFLFLSGKHFKHQSLLEIFEYKKFKSFFRFSIQHIFSLSNGEPKINTRIFISKNFKKGLMLISKKLSLGRSSFHKLKQKQKKFTANRVF